MAIKSKRGAMRRYYAIIRQCYRDLAGGTQYGIDMPTLSIVFPERYAEIQALRAMFRNLPD
jgi:hypothetical protein